MNGNGSSSVVKMRPLAWLCRKCLNSMIYIYVMFTKVELELSRRRTRNFTLLSVKLQAQGWYPHHVHHSSSVFFNKFYDIMKQNENELEFMLEI